MLRTTSSLALTLALAFPLSALAQTAVGKVTSLSGDVRASGAGGDRALACGDSVYPGETVTTAKDASAGVVMGDVLAQLDSRTSLKLDRTVAGTADADLDWGRVRMIDAREDGTQAARLSAKGSYVVVQGNDAEAYVLAEKGGDYVMFCEWDAPLAVHRGGETEKTGAQPLRDLEAVGGALRHRRPRRAHPARRELPAGVRLRLGPSLPEAAAGRPRPAGRALEQPGAGPRQPASRSV